MQDRIPTKPNRYAVYDDAHNFVRYEYHERADEPTQTGDALNKANFLPNDVAVSLGIDPTTNPQVKDALMAVKPWRLLHAYTVAGTHTFTTPAGIKELGAFIVGGGGRGSSAKTTDSSKESRCTGGAAGYTNTKIIENPSGNYPIVVGAGGTSSEKNGGSSSFNGAVAKGGGGGNSLVTSDPSGGGVAASAVGGQSSSSIGYTYKSFVTTGKTRAFGAMVGTDFPQPAYFAVNPFDKKRLLIAGGYAHAATEGAGYQTAVVDDYGNSGSSGAASNSGTANAIKGTSYGCGGGASATFGNYTSTSAADGADGAVLVYGR